MKNLKDMLNEAQEGMGIYLVLMMKDGNQEDAAITILPTRCIQERGERVPGTAGGELCMIKPECIVEVASTVLTSNIVYFPDFRDQKWEPSNTRNYTLVKPSYSYLNQIIDIYNSLGRMYTDISKTIKGYKKYL